jgi:glycosyltransferase involved in cell wall biosynthesis
MKLIIATDAWTPQVNGVVRTYQNILPFLHKKDIDCTVIHPYLKEFKRNKLKAYPEIEYVSNPTAIKKVLQETINKDVHVHIATEGPIGVITRLYCTRNNIKFTTCFHTLFPEFLQERWGIPTWISYTYFRWFHKKSQLVFVPTEGIKKHLAKKGIFNTEIWTRGVDKTLFSPKKRKKSTDQYILCVSRVSKEKGLDDFCQLNHPNKVLIGDGPYLESLKRNYPTVNFLGKKEGEELANWYANADCFVFPSQSDTFGIVLLESIASGTPIAAYPEPGPLEVIKQTVNGYIDKNLQIALENCKSISRNSTYITSEKWSWDYSCSQFVNTIKNIRLT